MCTVRHLIVVAGPTSSGKSDFAVELAHRYNGEVISADSRQIYRGLDIGTGKITEEDFKNQEDLKSHLPESLFNNKYKTLVSKITLK